MQNELINESCYVVLTVDERVLDQLCKTVDIYDFDVFPLLSSD